MAINNAHIDKLFSKLLSEIVPTAEEIEETNEYSNELMGRLKGVMPKDVEIILAGSVARGTQIRGKSDIDIFLLFPKYLGEREMEHKAIELSKKIIDKKNGESYEINYAEHPYIKLINKPKSISADIVPAFKIRDSSERASAVDRTQLHNIFVLKNLNGKQKNDVRVLKYILQRHNIYGAESSKHGFSGYLCELLIAHYGSITRLLNEIADTRLPLLIDVSKHYAVAGPDVPKEHTKRFNSSIIVIDPTDPNRNVAASVSPESISRLILISRDLLSNPSMDAIYGYRYSDTEKVTGLDKFLKGNGLELDCMCFKLPDISEDTLWPQLDKLKNRIEHEANNNGFPMIASFSRMELNLGVIAFLHNHNEIGSRKVIGPEVTIKAAADEFLKKHSGEMKISVEGTKIISIEKPAYKNFRELLNHVILDKKFDFTKDIKKNKCVIHSDKLPEDYKLIVYHGLIEKLNI